MSTYARVVDKSVIETFALPESFAIDQCFHPDLPGRWIECEDHVAQGWQHDGESFHPPHTGDG